MIVEAILHVPLSKDAYAIDERTLVIRLRTGKGDMASCSMLYGDRVCINEPIDVIQINMEKIASDSWFDYYEARFQSDYTRVCYYFQLRDTEGKVLYYSEYGFTDGMRCHRTQYFQFPYIHRNDIVRVPEWTKDMVMYHIFPDSFADGRRTISEEGKRIKLSQALTSESKNGGTIKGITANLDYLQKLHVNCIYLNPIFKAASYHKYDTIDYFEIDPCFGNKEEFKDLVKQCHERGIYVILDGVFNHCGSGFFAFQDVLRNGEHSKYRDWFYHMTFPIKYDTPPGYEAFAYVREMPKLNTGNPEVEQYLCDVGKYWIQEMDIDGWRLDVANEINHGFWRSFRNAVKEVKKEAFLIGEIWEDSSAWLMGDQFDSTMNYTFSYICREFFAQRKITVREFAKKVDRMNLRYPEQVAMMQMNFLDTHDIPRFYTYCDGDVKRLELAVFFMMTAQGIPSVFYGDEKGIVGESEEEYRSPMPWREINCKELTAYYADMIELRRKHSALQTGTYRTVYVDEPREIYGFIRENKKEKLLVLLNMSNYEHIVNITSFFDDEIVCPPMRGKIIPLTNK